MYFYAMGFFNMQPIGNHIKIIIPPAAPQVLILDKQPLIKAIATDISPDITVPFKQGDSIYLAECKIVHLQEQIFIKEEYIFLYETDNIR